MVRRGMVKYGGMCGCGRLVFLGDVHHQIHINFLHHFFHHFHPLQHHPNHQYDHTNKHPSNLRSVDPMEGWLERERVGCIGLPVNNSTTLVFFNCLATSTAENPSCCGGVVGVQVWCLRMVFKFDFQVCVQAWG